MTKSFIGLFRKTYNAKLCMAIFSLSHSILVTSCATISHGPTQDIPVSTIPPGATVSIENTDQLSPSTFTLKRNRDYVLTVTMEGYETERVKIVHVISGAAAGNLLGLGLLGVAIDTATGALWKLEPENIQITLRARDLNEHFDEAEILSKKTLPKKLEDLARLRKANLITKSQYIKLRDITIHCAT